MSTEDDNDDDDNNEALKNFQSSNEKTIWQDSTPPVLTEKDEAYVRDVALYHFMVGI
jgi:hypothetical protein